MKAVFTCLVFALISSQNISANIEVHGHRGARAIYPENTLVGFQYALNSGADALELDVVVTKDDVLIVAHDVFVNKKICKTSLKGKNILFRSLTLQEVKNIDCGSIQSSKFPNQRLVPGEKIPTLEEFFKFVQKSSSDLGKVIKVNLEAKMKPSDAPNKISPVAFSRLILNMIQKYEMNDKVIIQSFNIETLKEIRRQDSAIEISVLTKKGKRHFLSLCQEVDCQYISPRFKRINKKIVSDLKLRGIRVIPWTPNKVSHWKKVIEMGVHAIITDDPEGLIKYLKQTGY